MEAAAALSTVLAAARMAAMALMVMQAPVAVVMVMMVPVLVAPPSEDPTQVLAVLAQMRMTARAALVLVAQVLVQVAVMEIVEEVMVMAEAPDQGKVALYVQECRSCFSSHLQRHAYTSNGLAHQAAPAFERHYLSMSAKLHS